MPFPVRAPGPLETREFDFPEVRTIEFDNGLKLHLVENHSVPLVGIKVAVLYGLTEEENSLPGISHVLGEMLSKGTSGRSAEQIAEQVDFLGTEIAATATKDCLSISSTVLSEFIDQALDIISDIVINPTFPDSELQKIIGLELATLVNKRTQPSYQARKVYSKVLYGGHPYGAFDTEEEFLQALDHEKLASFHSRHFNPRSVHLIVSGDINPEKAIDAAKARFEKWEAGPQSAPVAFSLAVENKRRVCIVDNPNAVQSNIYIGNLTIPYNHPDSIPLLVTNQVLGGSFASRLFMNLREQKSFTYGAYSKARNLVKGGALIAYAAVRNEVTIEAIDEFLHEFRRMREEPVDETELGEARDFITGSFPLHFETSINIAGHVLLQRLHSLPDDYWDMFRQRVNDVTPDLVMETARKYIHPEEAIICVVGKASELKGPLSEYGEVELYDKNGKSPD